MPWLPDLSSKNKKVNSLVKRTLTGAAFAAVMLGIPLAGKIAFVLLFTIVSALSLIEYFQILIKAGKNPQKITGILSGLIIYSISALYILKILPEKYLWISLAFLFMPFIAELWRNKPQPIENVALTVSGLVYVILPSILVTAFSTIPGLNESWIIIYTGFLLLIWANDTFAYLTGSVFGKHKLFKRISPAKTIEGTIGGVLFTILAAWLLHFTKSPLNEWQWMMMATVICLSAIPGDLVESLFKRSLGIKDSGNLLPGHGGMLDRFDAMFLSAPFVFLYLVMILSN